MLLEYSTLQLKLCFVLLVLFFWFIFILELLFLKVKRDYDRLFVNIYVEQYFHGNNFLWKHKYELELITK